jgi:hypothetical protein
MGGALRRLCRECTGDELLGEVGEALHQASTMGGTTFLPLVEPVL